MAEKKFKKKLVVKKKQGSGTIADKISQQKSSVTEQAKAARPDVVQETPARPSAPVNRDSFKKRPVDSRPQTQSRDSKPSVNRTVFIDPQSSPVSKDGGQGTGPSNKKSGKKKSRLREDVLRHDEHKKFFIKQKTAAKNKQVAETPTQNVSIPKEIKITEYIQVGELARKLNVKTSDIIAQLMKMGVMATITQSIDADTVTLLASEYGCEVSVVSLYDETLITTEPDQEEELHHRPPVVTIMGHVDHGKTKLLDALRQTDIVSLEAGGITQHIGAYQINHPKGKITFLDTPGHEAFTAMRARGAQVTDIVVLVVAADDGVMPQTMEAIQHAKDAEVPIIVAVNKVDKTEANPEKVKQELTKYDLVPEDWSGTTPFVEISALKKLNLDKLEDIILTQAEIMEIKANPDKKAEGIVIEAKLDQGRGSVATILVTNGTLKMGDPFVVGLEDGRVRAMFNDKGQQIKEAHPGTPVEILGLGGVPNAGAPFHVMGSEKDAKDISEKRQELNRQQQAQKIKKVKQDSFNDFIEDGKVLEQKIIIKGDVRGSVEALTSSFEKLDTSEVRVNVILGGTGEISESDVMLASAAGAVMIAFNTRANAKVRELASKEGVEIKSYNVIYQAIDEVKAMMSGLLSPDIMEEITGELEVREIYKISAIGTVGGSMVTSGIIKRVNPVRIIRDGVAIYTGRLKSLKRFQDDVGEVKEGFECGILIESYNDIKVGDVIEGYEEKEHARSLD